MEIMDLEEIKKEYAIELGHDITCFCFSCKALKVVINKLSHNG